jgi:16S rRNA processing protein RimM
MGRVVGPFGVRGWVKLKTFTENLENLAGYPTWWVTVAGIEKPTQVDAVEIHASHIVAKLAGVEDRDQALALRGADISIPREALPPVEEGEFYWADLVGLDVVNIQGEYLGQVKDLLETGANDVLVVKGDKERLLPYVDAIVLEVNLAEKLIRVDWGLDY